MTYSNGIFLPNMAEKPQETLDFQITGVLGWII